MIRKSMLVALLGLSLTGCAVYGDSGYGGGYRDYDRQYYPRVQRYPLYEEPRVYIYEQRRYLPPPPPRHFAPPPPPRGYFQGGPRFDPRYQGRHDRHARDYRQAPPPGWEGQRHHYQQQQQSPRRPQGAPLQWQQREAPQHLNRGRMRER